MNLCNGECDEPHKSFYVFAVDKRMRISVIICETARVQTALPIVSQQEICVFRYLVGNFLRVTACGRVFVGFALIALVYVELWEFDFFASFSFLKIDTAISKCDCVSGDANNTFDVVFLPITWGTKNDNISILWLTHVVCQFVDDDVLLMFECIRHGAAFYLKGRDEKCTYHSDNRHNDDDIQDNIEEVEPQAVLFWLHLH